MLEGEDVMQRFRRQVTSSVSFELCVVLSFIDLASSVDVALAVSFSAFAAQAGYHQSSKGLKTDPPPHRMLHLLTDFPLI